MINLATIKLAAKTGMLWVAIGVLLSTHSCAYLVGRAHSKAAVAEEQAKEAKKETKAIIKEVKKRAPVVTKKEQVATEQKERIRVITRTIHEATEQRQVAPNCDLSDAEYDAYGMLGSEINKIIDARDYSM